jgi:hypothetical protein
MTVKKKAKPVKSSTSVSEINELKDKLAQSIELGVALTNEVDNLMSQDLPPAQTGKVLGDIMSSFSEQVQLLKTSIEY